MTDYRDELLNKILLVMDDAGFEDLTMIKDSLIRVIGNYEIKSRCTDVAVVDDDCNLNIIKLFLASKKIEGGSKATARFRWYIINKFSRDLNKPFADISKFEILHWLQEEQNNVSLASSNTYLNVIKSLYNWMYTNKMIVDNPLDSLKPIKHPKPLKTSFTVLEIDSMRNHCKNIVDRVLLEMLLSSGLRCEELCNLKWDDVNMITKDICVYEGKGNKNRVTMMDDITKKYLLEYKDSLKFESDYIFAVRYAGTVKPRTSDSVWLRLNKLAKDAGINKANPHKFRHTFATTLYRRGLDVRMIQKLMGHSNINTTMVYIDDDIETLRDAYKKCVA